MDYEKLIGQTAGAVAGFGIGNFAGIEPGWKAVGKAIDWKRKNMAPIRYNKRKYVGAPQRPMKRRATYSNKKSINYDGVTTQKDDRLVYRKKPMPKRKKRQWKKFVKKVNAVAIKERGLQVALYRKDYNISPTAGTQLWGIAHLYGCANINTEPGVGDVNQLLLDVNVAAQKYGGGLLSNAYPEVANQKMKVPVRMQSAILDLTFVNNGSVPLVVDIYHLWYNKNMNSPSFGDANNWVDNNEVIRQEGTTGTPTANAWMKLDQKGVKLFDCNQLLSKLAATVRSVRQIILQPGGIHTMAIRDPRNYRLDMFSYLIQDGVQYQGYADRKITESVFWIARNESNVEGAAELSVKCNRTYRYTIEGVKTSTSGIKTI